jgi:hypothetical protein
MLLGFHNVPGLLAPTAAAEGLSAASNYPNMPADAGAGRRRGAWGCTPAAEGEQEPFSAPTALQQKAVALDMFLAAQL